MTPRFLAAVPFLFVGGLFRDVGLKIAGKQEWS